jgi:PHD-finger
MVCDERGEVDQPSSKQKPSRLSTTKSRLLPDLSASTQEILARVQAESAIATAGAIAGEVSKKPKDDLARLQSVSNTTTHFQRPKMASGIFDKSKLKSAFASALIPKSKTLPSQAAKELNSQPSTVATVSAHENSPLQVEKSPQPAAEVPTEQSAKRPAERPTELLTSLSNVPPARLDESTIEVMPSSTKSARVNPSSADAGVAPKPNAEKTETPKETPKRKGRMSHSYVLPSGEIVNSGKGLGRGRPGIKRGPRKPKSLSTPTPSEVKPISRKRKRSSKDSDIDAGSASRSPSNSGSGSDDEIAPQATQTRSGRHTQRPPAFVLPESPSNKKPRLSESSSTEVGKLPIKRKVYKGKEQSALCEHCLRGYGPLKNAIVFCDGCNKCWHQRCHDPMIPRKLVLDPSSEWFCHDCTAVKQKAKKAACVQKADVLPAAAEASSAAPQPSADTARREYFDSLPKDILINMLMHASHLAPNLPLWPPIPVPAALPSQPSNQAITTPNAPASVKEDAYPTPENEVGDHRKADDAEEDEDEDEDDEDADEHARLYPKPGNGVPLPPEAEDLAMLLEGPESTTFSHSLREGVVGIAPGSGRAVGR